MTKLTDEQIERIWSKWESADLPTPPRSINRGLWRQICFARAIEARIDGAGAGGRPVALESVELTRDVYGMCIVKINGREAIRDNGDVISHFATLDWFAAHPPVPSDHCESARELARMWLNTHYADKYTGAEIEARCWAILGHPDDGEPTPKEPG